MLPDVLTFEDTELEVIDRDGLVWLRGSQIGGALGYLDDKAVNHIYVRNEDEFTEEMTCVVKLTTQGQLRDVRVFSLRGAHLLGMFARTERAKAFRRWVLDVLDGIADVPVAASAPSRPTSVAHRADHIVSASRSFNSLLRVGNALRLGHAHAARLANAATFQRTGVDLLEELGITDEDLHAAEPFEDELRQFVQQQTAPFSMQEAGAWLDIAPDKLTPSITGRIGAILRKLGCGRKDNNRTADPSRRRLYLPPSMLKREADSLAQPI